MFGFVSLVKLSELAVFTPIGVTSRALFSPNLVTTRIDIQRMSRGLLHPMLLVHVMVARVDVVGISNVIFLIFVKLLYLRVKYTVSF
jgi:hypothetical protein